jgi:hypothetical protein
LDNIKPILGPKYKDILDQKKDPISLIDLADLSGCAIEAIKNELGIECEEISMEELRKKMLNFLHATMKISN